MEKTFKNDLQTHIQKLGVSDKKFVLKETQHPLDKVLHECFVADTLYRIGSQRREIARSVFKKELATQIFGINATAAALGLTQNEELLNTGNYTLSIQAKRPSMKLNAVKLRTELIKLGVSDEILEEAWNKASEEQDSVDVFTVNTTGNGS